MEKIILCKICASNQLCKKFTVNAFSLYSCKNCKFVGVYEKLSDNDVGKIYDIEYINHSKYNDAKTLIIENKRRVDLVKKYADQGKTLLDVGCGNGNFMSYAKSYYSVNGVDISTDLINKAKIDNPDLKDRLFAGDSCSYILKKRFDIIVMWDIIEHVWDPKELLQNQLNHLNTNGFIFLSTPNIGSFFAKLTGKYWPFMTPPEHLSFFTLRTINYLSEIMDTEIVYFNSMGKTVNLVFLLYKIKKIIPKLVPESLINYMRRSLFNNLSIYIPTNDIAYFVLKKK